MKMVDLTSCCEHSARFVSFMRSRTANSPNQKLICRVDPLVLLPWGTSKRTDVICARTFSLQYNPPFLIPLLQSIWEYWPRTHFANLLLRGPPTIVPPTPHPSQTRGSTSK